MNRLKQNHATPREIATVVNGILDGKTNNFGEITLDANQGSTTFTDFRISKDSVILLEPTTANAAAALATTYRSATSVPNHTFTLTHTNDANADKTFNYVVVG